MHNTLTREEIIRMAREAGFQIRGDVILTRHSSGAWVGVNEELEHFTAMVAARAAAAEREACRAECQALADLLREHGDDGDASGAEIADSLADAMLKAREK